MSTLHPLTTSNEIRTSYQRYLRTIYPLRDAALREGFWHELEKPDLLVKGPILESAPPFLPGRSIDELINADILHSGFRTLCSPALPLHRPLHLHQDQAIEHVVRYQRNLIVATGTGSGKTEAFLLPMLDHLLREDEAGTLSQAGVRILLLYPMNALANDQLKRLRRVLELYPTITFGRFTGETPEHERDATERFRQQFQQDHLLPNEFFSRERMRATPPHILLTNYSMLEYLLLRPEDCTFFDGTQGKHWRFIVLDEAHTYDGASGIEVGMLLRRLKDRIIQSEVGRIRCIATSATLGDGRKDFRLAAEFATNLFGERFEWQEDDITRQDVVESSREPTSALGHAWGQGSPELYRQLRILLLTC